MENAFLNCKNPDENLCLLCENEIGKEKKTAFGEKGWNNVTEKAREWSNLNIPQNDQCYGFTKVFEKIEGTNLAGYAHNSCRIKFRTKCELFRQRFGVRDCIEERNDEDSDIEMTTSVCNRRSSSTLFFIRTSFIRTFRLRFGHNLRTS